MVDKLAIKQAIHDAEKKTSAELVSVITPRSDSYKAFMLAIGMLVGSAIAVLLWGYEILLDFPALLGVQIITVLVFLILTPLQILCIGFIPRQVRHHRAAHRAYEEYLLLSHHLPAGKPMLLFYVSLAERYVHIWPNPVVREKIAVTEWERIVGEFTSALPKQGVTIAATQAIRQMSETLAKHFPV
jgi:putative membrane protein